MSINTPLLTLIATTTTSAVEDAISEAYAEGLSALYKGREAVNAARQAAEAADCEACKALVDSLRRRLRDVAALEELRAECRELEWQLKQRDTPPGR